MHERTSRDHDQQVNGARRNDRQPPPAVADILGLQRRVGNRALSRALSPLSTVAATPVELGRLLPVVASPETDRLVSDLLGSAGAVQRESDHDSLKANDRWAGLGEGNPLPAADRSRLERAYEYDLSKVRLHTDDHARALAGTLGANAFTVANHVVFGRGNPTDHRLLAHEVAHVVQQQGQDDILHAGTPRVSVGNTAAEADANESTSAVLTGQSRPPSRQPGYDIMGDGLSVALVLFLMGLAFGGGMAAAAGTRGPSYEQNRRHRQEHPDMWVNNPIVSFTPVAGPALHVMQATSAWERYFNVFCMGVDFLTWGSAGRLFLKGTGLWLRTAETITNAQSTALQQAGIHAVTADVRNTAIMDALNAENKAVIVYTTGSHHSEIWVRVGTTYRRINGNPLTVLRANSRVARDASYMQSRALNQVNAYAIVESPDVVANIIRISEELAASTPALSRLGWSCATTQSAIIHGIPGLTRLAPAGNAAYLPVTVMGELSQHAAINLVRGRSVYTALNAQQIMMIAPDVFLHVEPAREAAFSQLGNLPRLGPRTRSSQGTNTSFDARLTATEFLQYLDGGSDARAMPAPMDATAAEHTPNQLRITLGFRLPPTSTSAPIRRSVAVRPEVLDAARTFHQTWLRNLLDTDRLLNDVGSFFPFHRPLSEPLSAEIHTALITAGFTAEGAEIVLTHLR